MPTCKNDPNKKYKGTEPSPKGLGWCAHGEKEGKVRKGKDGNQWIVKKVSNGSKRWVKKSAVKKIVIKNTEENNSTLFVFYTFHTNRDKERWTYGKFQNNWWWVGSGTTTPIGAKKNLYELEEQFSGPSKSKVKMRDYLDKFFIKLKNKGILKRYKIRNTYAP
jgi:hypothetical protein